MLRQIAQNEFEVTSITLDERGSSQLEALMGHSDPHAQEAIEAAVERARVRLAHRPLNELLAPR